MRGWRVLHRQEVSKVVVGSRGKSCYQDGTSRKQGVRHVMWRDKDIPEGWKKRKEEQF